ncbi:MAG: phage tail assembly protein [Sphingomonadaceae bacterium]|nr:phage tail assembly protein [Sphingomonadaceae bacterium]
METPETAPALDNSKFKTVKLMEPIVRGETSIDTLTLRKPGSGELRGLNLQNIYTLDVGTILTIVTRISTPSLTSEEADMLSPNDLMEIGGTIKGFFMTAGERAAMDAMIREATGSQLSSS